MGSHAMWHTIIGEVDGTLSHSTLGLLLLYFFCITRFEVMLGHSFNWPIMHRTDALY